KGRCRLRVASRSSKRARLSEISGANLFESPCLGCENTHPSSHNGAIAASLAYWESGHNHLRQMFRAMGDSSPENPSRRRGKPCFAWRKSEDSPAALVRSMLRRSYRPRPDLPCRLRSQPSKHAWSESAEKFCEWYRRQNESCPARPQQDFAVQRTPAGWRVHCLKSPRAPDNGVRSRSAAFLRRSRSNDGLCTYFYTCTSICSTFVRQLA